MKRTGLRLSPCGVPIVLSNGSAVALATLTVIVVLWSRWWMRHVQSGLVIADITSSSFRRLIVSKALDMSRPRM